MKSCSKWFQTDQSQSVFICQPMRERDSIASEWNPASLLIALNFRCILFRLLNSYLWLMRHESYTVMTRAWLIFVVKHAFRILIFNFWCSFVKSMQIEIKMHYPKYASKIMIIIFGLNQALKRGFGPGPVSRPVQISITRPWTGSWPEVIPIWTGNGPDIFDFLPQK